MTRYIAIVTLALIAALSADQVFAQRQDDVDHPGTLQFNPGMVADVDHPGTLQFNPGMVADVDHPGTLQWSIVANTEHPDTLSFSLIAIIAFESGPEAAYLMLLDMGFSDREAYDMVLSVLINSEGGGTD